MKVIFLDIDGVLNSTRSCLGLGGFPHPDGNSKNWHLLDPVAVGLLRRVVRRTGAVCVLSSTWRMHADIAALAEYLAVPIIDKTRETIARERRGEQIRDWLAAHPEVERYAILDDDCDMMHEQLPYFVKCQADDGLSYESHEQLIALMGGEVH